MADRRLRIKHKRAREREVAVVHGQQRQAALGVDVGEAVAVAFGAPGHLGEQVPGAVGVSQPHRGDALNEAVDGRDERVVSTW
jgi:hypothetical protein